MDDEEFEDSGFDDLNADALDRLETQALTQHQSQYTVVRSQQGHVREKSRQQISSDYGFDDEEEEVINLDAYDGNTTHTFDNAGHMRRIPAAERGINNENIQQDSAYDEPSGPEKDVNSYGMSESMDLATLQNRVAELQQERFVLEKSADDARSAVMSKSGEIAIVRANHDKAVKEYERRMLVMQKLHAEEVMKFKAELDTARKNREKMETSNRFLEHDLAQELEKAKQTRKASKPAQPARLVVGDATSTPRKTNKPLPFRDGFDDDEVMIVSPSKSRDKRGTSTPKAGSKRKRPGVDKSPAKPLDMSPSEGMLVPDAPESPSPAPSREIYKPAVLPNLDGDKLEFMRLIVNHRTSPTQQRTLDALAQYKIPGQDDGAISSLIYDGLTTLSSAQAMDECRKTFCEHLAGIWSQLLEQKFYAPLYTLTELLFYILFTSSMAMSANLIPLLVPLCYKTIDLITFPTVNKSRESSTRSTPPDDLKSDINLQHYFNLLNHLIGSCLYEESSLTAFWSAIPFDFVLVMLHRAQPLTHITFMLELLGTSVLENTFGPVDDSNPLQQPRRESSLIDRLTVLLFEMPDPPPRSTADGKPLTISLWHTPKALPLTAPYPPEQLLTLRSSVLSLLRQLCTTDHGGDILASHRLAFGRLVRFLHESVLAMYAYRSTHAQSTHHVNTSVVILAHLSFCHSDSLDLRARLAVIPQGAQKHLVALSRVAFAEGETPLESGIEAEVAEAAHRMLDECLSPEEGEAVMHVFSSAMSVPVVADEEREEDTEVATTGEGVVGADEMDDS